jgi:hypothetical protein
VDLGVLVVSNELLLLSFCRATLFVIQLGQVDRGATLSWISQFPLEEEVLLPPLSNLEVVGEPVEIQTMAGDPLTMGTVRVVKLRLNVNLKVNPQNPTLVPKPSTLNSESSPLPQILTLTPDPSPLSRG